MADRVQGLLKTTRAALKAAADPEFKAGALWFFKEPVKPYGVRTPQLRELARLAYAQVKQWPVAERDRFVTELWKSGMLEEGVIVCHLYRRFAKSCGDREFAMFEQWIDRYVGNWSHCDGVSTWLIAASITNRPGLADRLARLDQVEESLEAAVGGGFAGLRRKAREEYRDNSAHLRFAAQ